MADTTRNVRTGTKLLKGINTDVHPLDQAPGTYRFALNMLLESREGDYTSMVNEEGNILTDGIVENYGIIGTIFADNNQVIIFSTSGINGDGKSRIGIMDSKGEYTDLIISTCLGFQLQHPIQGVFRLRNGCERVIYFTDDYNSLRSINLDNLQQYTIGGVDPATANSTDAWDCGKFKNNRDYDICSITSATVNDGGGVLKVGSYFFAVRYLDIDRNPTNWFYISQNVNIGAGSTQDEKNYDGGVFDLVTVDTFNEGKSVTLTIDDIDQEFNFVQLAVIKMTRANGYETTVSLVTEKEITSSTLEYTYTGDPNSETNYTLDEIVIPKIVFNRVKTLTQIDNRLVLGNIADDIRDWAEFQRQTSQTYMLWTTDIAPISQINPDPATTSEKGAYYSLMSHGYMRDEIYAFGLVYVFNDGSESPVFHIPGRPVNFAKGTDTAGFFIDMDNADLVTQGNSNTHNRNQVPIGENWDTQILTVKDTVTDPTTQISTVNVAHIPSNEFITGTGEEDSTIYRWKVWNTAVGTILPDGNGEVRMGVMGYYEADNTYQTVEDCNGDSVWGVDVQGNPLVGEKIRHHRMPDTVLCNIRTVIGDVFPTNTRTGYIDSLYAMVCNVNYPVDYASVIQGYYLVRVERDSTNSTVIDKGVIGLTRDNYDHTNAAGDIMPEGDIIPDFFLNNDYTGVTGDTENSLVFYSPKVFFNRTSGIYNGYLKTERILNTRWSLQVGAFAGGSTSALFPFSYAIIPDTINAYRDIDGYVFVNGGSLQPPINNFSQSIANIDYSTDVLCLHVESPFDNSLLQDKNDLSNDDFELHYVALKVWINPYRDLSNLQYIRTHNGLLTDTGTNSFEHVRTGGDCYITELAWKHTAYSSLDNLSVNPGFVSVLGNGGTGPSLIYLDFFAESLLNCDLRMTGEQPYETHAYKVGSPVLTAIDYFGAVLTSLANAADDFPNQERVRNYFVPNLDMSRVQNFNKYFPLPNSYDYCSQCEQDFPNRLWYSDRSYQEDTDDKYKVFRANNYRDLYGEDPEVYKLVVYNDELYALTPYTTWFVPTRPQQLTSNEGNIYVGTGDVLSVPPKRLQSSEIGYAGSRHPWAVTNTEFGITYVDSEAGKVFLLRQQPQELSAMGLRSWFRENLPIRITDYIPEFNILNTAHPHGAGFISCYDPMHNRIILTKKDHRPLIPISEILVSGEYEDTTGYTIGYNYNSGYYYYFNGDLQIIEQEPAAIGEFDIDNNFIPYFEDLNWTISYAFNQQCWDSYHSYRPAWLWNNRTHFYSSTRKMDGEIEGLYQHGTRQFGLYYDEICPSVVDFVFNNIPTNSKTLSSFQFISYAQEYINEEWVDLPYESFYKIFVYNGFQSSGILDVTVKNTDVSPFIELDDSFDSIRISNNENTWSISEFYDMTIDTTEPIFTSNYNNPEYRFNRTNYGFINYPNSNRIDFTKSQFEQEAFRDNWVGCRVWYDNTPESYKYVTQFGHSTTNISFR